MSVISEDRGIGRLTLPATKMVSTALTRPRDYLPRLETVGSLALRHVRGVLQLGNALVAATLAKLNASGGTVVRGKPCGEFLRVGENVP